MLQKEKKTLESKRLDLDACKARLKKLTEGPVKLDVSFILCVFFLFFLYATGCAVIICVKTYKY